MTSLIFFSRRITCILFFLVFYYLYTFPIIFFSYPILFYSFFFFLNDTAPPEISPLSLHDALPIPVVAADEGVRANPDPEKMATLKAVFAANGTTTAGNSSQVSDGAAALLIASRAYAKKHGLKPRARFVSTAVAAADPVIQFTAVLDSTRKALKESRSEEHTSELQ